MSYKKFLGAASAALMIVIAVFMLAPGTWAQAKYKSLHRFNKRTAYPNSSLIFDTSGNLYGTTSDWYGTVNEGTVFKLTPQVDGQWNETTIHTFTLSDKGGIYPQNPLVIDSAGNLYGATWNGGACGSGTVFMLAPGANGKWTESVPYSFCAAGAAGAEPQAGLTLDSAGNLYGTTSTGGHCEWCGTVFELTPGTNGQWTETTLHYFDGNDGGFASGNLLFDAGNLYGTANGEFTGYGTVFKLTPGANGQWTDTVLYTFCAVKNCSDGFGPSGNLTFDAAGNLYGTANWGGHDKPCPGSPRGCGVVFQLSPGTNGQWTETVLHAFNGKDGTNPGAGVVLDSVGNLWGTVSASVYRVGYGAVFELTPTSAGGWVYHVVHAFKDKPGANPQGGLTFDQTGNLYGTTAGDGTTYVTTTFGSMFEITP